MKATILPYSWVYENVGAVGEVKIVHAVLELVSFETSGSTGRCSIREGGILRGVREDPNFAPS